METKPYEMEPIWDTGAIIGSVMSIVSLLVLIVLIYSVFRLLFAMIRYYERLNREAKNKN